MIFLAGKVDQGVHALAQHPVRQINDRTRAGSAPHFEMIDVP